MQKIADYTKHPNANSGRLCRELSPVEAAYIAGLFDGEGAVMITQRLRPHKRQATPNYSVYVGVTNTNKEVLDWLERVTRFGRVYTSTKASGKRRTAYRWQANGLWQTGRFLEQLYPFLRIKKKRVHLILNNMDDLGSVREEFASLNKRGR